MNGWFIAFILWIALGLSVATAKHGEKREGNYSFGESLLSCVILIILVYMAIKTGF